MSEFIDEISFPLPFSRLWRAKRILAIIWEEEKRKSLRAWRRQVPTPKSGFDSHPTFTIQTKDYTAILEKACDIMGDGTSWFEFSLHRNGTRIFQNTNWRSCEHFYDDAKSVLRHAKEFRRQYIQQADESSEFIVYQRV